jgi:hypothetical protein
LLFADLKVAGIVPNEMERTVLAVATPRNAWGGHGRGAVAHSVSVEEAEAVFASAAVAITCLHSLVP